MSRPSYALQITTSRVREIRDLLTAHVNASSDIDFVRTEAAKVNNEQCIASFAVQKSMDVSLTKQELLNLLNARLDVINAKLRALNVGVVDDSAHTVEPIPVNEESDHDHAAV
jgi:hypothetical protein